MKDADEQEAIARAGAAADRYARRSGWRDRRRWPERIDVSKRSAGAWLSEGHRTVNFRDRRLGAELGEPAPPSGGARDRAGDVVVCDFGGSYAFDGDVGYCSDTDRGRSPCSASRGWSFVSSTWRSKSRRAPRSPQWSPG